VAGQPAWGRQRGEARVGDVTTVPTDSDTIATDSGTEPINRFVMVPVPDGLVDDVTDLVRQCEQRAATAERLRDRVVGGDTAVITVMDEHDEPIDFECANDFSERWESEEALSGRAYPHFPFVEDVQVVLDVGARSGAASLHFARSVPDATVHAVEVDGGARELLERNLGECDNVEVHIVDLSSDWLAASGIERADVLRVSISSREVEVLMTVAPLLAGVKVLYIEYEYRASHREVEQLLGATHVLETQHLAFGQARALYFRRDISERDDLPQLMLERIGGL